MRAKPRKRATTRPTSAGSATADPKQAPTPTKPEPAPAPAPRIRIKSVPIESISFDPENVRDHQERGLSAIGASLEEFGAVLPLVVQAGTGRLIAGHGRLIKLRERGDTHVDVTEFAGTDAQCRALAIALNRTGDLSRFNDAGLAEQLGALEGAVPLEALGFTAEEVETLRQSIDFESQIAAAFASSGDDKPAGGNARHNGLSKDRLIKVTPVLFVGQAESLERAIAATGKPNRGAALTEIAEFYLAFGGGGA